MSRVKSVRLRMKDGTRATVEPYAGSLLLLRVPERVGDDQTWGTRIGDQSYRLEDIASVTVEHDDTEPETPKPQVAEIIVSPLAPLEHFPDAPTVKLSIADNGVSSG
jgi:hypothetical protein